MRKLTTLLAAAAIAVGVAACQLLPFTPSNGGSDGQSPGAAQSPGGAETFAPTKDPFETVPASPGGEPSTDDPGPSPSIEIPPPID